jgi:nitrite reductase (NADH) small subunit
VSLHFVAQFEDLEEAKPAVFTVEGRSLGLILSNGEVRAVRNVCPHKRAPVCRGQVRGTMLPSDPDKFVFGMDGEILQCPWHGWEFSLKTGETVCKAEDRKLTFYPVVVKDGAVYVDI